MSVYLTKNKANAIRMFNPRARHFRQIPPEMREELGDSVAKVHIPGEYRGTFLQAPEPGDYWTSLKTARGLTEQYPGISIIEFG